MITTNPYPSARDFQEFANQMKAVESAPLTERQEARADYLDTLQNRADTLIERIEWLIKGNYGYVSYWHARNTIQNKRMNRTAWLGMTIAALEWNCPAKFAAEAWNSLPASQQEKITAMINAVIADALAEMEAEA